MIFFLFLCDLKISERAKLEVASFSDFRQKNDITKQTAQQWVCDVQLWAVTGNHAQRSNIFTNTVQLLITLFKYELHKVIRNF